MKKYLPLLLLLFIAQSMVAESPKNGYKITVKIDNLADSTIKLAHYYGDKKYIKDSATIGKDAWFVFKGDEALPGGIYLIVLSNKTYFEMVLTDDQHFSLHTDVNNFIPKMKIEGSQENVEFYEYLLYMAETGLDLRLLESKLEAEKGKSAKKALQKKMGELNKSVQDFKIDFIDKHPEHFISKVFITSREVEIPKAPKREDGTGDSLYGYNYYKLHFFDNVDFNNEDLLRTPVFHARVWKYMNKVSLQLPDSLSAAADRILYLAKDNEEIFKYCLITMLNKYANPKIMGQDAVYVHLVENYYSTGKAFWVDSTLLYRISEQAKTLKPLLIGKKAPNLILKDIDGRWTKLSDVPAENTLLIFWDPDCGHCKKTIPKVQPMLDRLGDGYDIKVFSVDTEGEEKRYKDFIQKYDLLDWIAVHDHEFRNHFRSIYDISSTPKIFLLDKDKIIIAKKLTLIQLEEFLRNKKKEKEKETSSK